MWHNVLYLTGKAVYNVFNSQLSLVWHCYALIWLVDYVAFDTAIFFVAKQNQFCYRTMTFLHERFRCIVCIIFILLGIEDCWGDLID